MTALDDVITDALVEAALRAYYGAPNRAGWRIRRQMHNALGTAFKNCDRAKLTAWLESQERATQQEKVVAAAARGDIEIGRGNGG